MKQLTPEQVKAAYMKAGAMSDFGNIIRVLTKELNDCLFDPQDLKHGLYVIHWKEEEGGGTSLASVGSGHDGKRWYAATNHVSGHSFDWQHVASVEVVKL